MKKMWILVAVVLIANVLTCSSGTDADIQGMGRPVGSMSAVTYDVGCPPFLWWLCGK